MMTLAIIQLAHIFVAKQVVEYAAFCGARAKLVGLDNEATSFCGPGATTPLNGAQVAALIPLSGLCGSAAADSTNGLTLPGWGSRTMSAQTYQAILAGIPAGPEGDAQREQLNAFYNAPQTQYLTGWGTASNPAVTPVNQSSTSSALPGVGWTITFNYPLRVPVGNVVAYEIGQLFLGVDSAYLTQIDIGNGPQPALVMTASCVLPNQ
jgi:hypothetical protein